MKIKFELNGRSVETEIADDDCLMNTLRGMGCASVKCGCDTTNCGMCTVLVEEKPVLSCAYLSARVNGKKVTTLEGLQEEAEAFAVCMAEEGADQCGFCNPGFVVNVIALKRKLQKASETIRTEAGGLTVAAEPSDESKWETTAEAEAETDAEKQNNGTEITLTEIREFLAGNICRCTGYASQERAIIRYLNEGNGIVKELPGGLHERDK